MHLIVGERESNSVFPSLPHMSICARVITGNRADHWNNFHPFLSANLPNIVKIFPCIYIYTQHARDYSYVNLESSSRFVVTGNKITSTVCWRSNIGFSLILHEYYGAIVSCNRFTIFCFR